MIIAKEPGRDQAERLRELMISERSPRVIAIASGKGGVGKSLLTVNLAIAMSELGSKVLVLDADFGLANVDVMLGLSSSYNVSHVLRGEKALDDIVQTGHGGVRFISGGSGVYELLSMDEGQLQSLLRGIISLETPVDCILCDMGAGIGDSLLQMILAATETVVVTTPEPTAILDAYALIKTLVHFDGSHPINLVMNKCDTRLEAAQVLDGFCKTIEKHLSKQIGSLGYVRYDQSIPESIRRQVPVIIASPESAAATDIRRLARTLLELPNESAPPHLLARLFSRLLGTRQASTITLGG